MLANNRVAGKLASDYPTTRDHKTNDIVQKVSYYIVNVLIILPVVD